MSRIVRRLGLLMVVVLVVIAAGFLWYAQPQPLLPEATAALASTPSVTFTEADDGRLTYEPASTAAGTGLILYPGGKVPPAAYAPAARAIAEAGYLVVIVSVPFNLAVFDIDAAARVIADHPEIRHWAVGGHSLGGSMAAQYIAGHPGTIEALTLWAAYAATDLAGEGLAVGLVYGSLDGGIGSYTSAEHLAYLGPDVTETIIEGGNHEQMGWYTGQPNDPPATTSRQSQQDQVVAATVVTLARLGGEP